MALGITSRTAVAEEAEPRIRGSTLAAAALSLIVAGTLLFTDGGIAKVCAGGAAVAAITASGLHRLLIERGRRRTRTPVLKRYQEIRVLDAPVETSAAAAAAERELRLAGFVVDRVEESRGTRVVLASRGGWAFTATMLAHVGLMLLVGGLAVGSPAFRVSASGALLLGVGASLRLAFDPQVAWCATRAAREGSDIEVVVSGVWFRGRLSRTADLLAHRLEAHLGVVA